MSHSYEFSNLDGFSCGAIGPKGKRIFYVQLREGEMILSLKMEKQQVAALTDFLDNTLAEVFNHHVPKKEEEGYGFLDSFGGGELPPEDSLAGEDPEDLAAAAASQAFLSDYDEPFFSDPDAPDWIVGKIGAAYQQSKDFIVLWMEELAAEEGESQSIAKFPLQVEQASNFVRQARTVMAAGRPPCPYCRAPLNWEDGFCPCWN